MRYGYDNDAAADYVRFQNYAAEFALLAEDLISAEVSADIRDMFYFAAWAAANELLPGARCAHQGAEDSDCSAGAGQQRRQRSVH